MKKIAFIGLGVLMAVLTVAGCKKKEADSVATPSVAKIGIAVPTADHGWTGGVGWWADFKVKEISAQYAGEIEFRVVHSANPTAQVADVENLVTWGMNYLVILPHESAPLSPIVRQVHDQGIRCIVVDRGLEPGNFGYVYIAGDNPGMGRESGKWLAAQMKKEGLTNYVAQGGLPILIDTQRMESFFAEMDKEPSLVNLEGKDKYQFANFSPQDSLRLMETHLQMYPKIDAVFCQDDDAMIGALQAIKESGRTDIKIGIGGAGSKAVYEMIKAGDPLVRATTLYHPSMIADAIQYAVDVVTGAKSDSFHNASQPLTVVIPSALIDESNVDQYYNPDSTF
ncbi:MAG: substrate-binding domain-containing protein [Spirochaetaceae bacterium]|jgi:ribose transport system substrate-binding protein|nr:substrate-binding domain-containing protein [Spirochaetaceae bacterium]